MSEITIKRLTGFNAKFIMDNKIGPGTVLSIIRSGGVIPHIHSVIKGTKPQMPSVPWVKRGVEARLAGDVTGGVTDQVVVRRLIHFFTTLGVEGLKGGTLSALFDAGLSSPKKILGASVATLKKAEGIQDKSAAAIRKELDALIRRGATVPALGDASGMFGVGIGQRKLQEVEAAVPDWLEVKDLSGALTGVHGFQATTINKIVSGRPKFVRFMKHLNLPVVKPAKPKKGPLTGLYAVFTGFRDAPLAEAIAKKGGVEGSSMGQATVVVAKDIHGSSSKLNAARAKGIPIMTPDQFKRKYL